MDGILVVNKPAGMTSFDVIRQLKKKYRNTKFGHTGTLDPDASGVLVVLCGKAVKALQFVSNTDKSYLASMILGIQTDTDDVSGQILARQEVHGDFDLESVLRSFIGPLHQKVPMASAKKVNGKKLYEYLREGKEVPEVYTDVEIYDIRMVDPEHMLFEVDCSGGTFIRSLCRDAAARTGNLGAMKTLVRTKANGFTLDEAISLDDLPDEPTLYPLWKVIDAPKIQAVNPADVKNGKSLRLDTDADRVLLMDGQEVLAVYDRHHQNVFSCTRGLWS